MRIAYFISSRTTFPPSPDEIAASSTVVENIISELKNRHEITVYAPKGSSYPGVKIVDLDFLPSGIDASHISQDWLIKSSLGEKQIFLNKIFEDSHLYDLIHLHNEPCYLGMPFASLVNTPVLFTTHNEYHPSDEKVFKYYEERVHLSALSKKQASMIPWKKDIPVIYNGLNTDAFPFVDFPDQYYLFFGRLVKDKGFDIFLDLISHMPDKKFVIAGKGDKALEEKAKEIASKNTNVIFHGMVKNKSEQWFDLISHAKALIMPNRYEDSCPLVPLEAMACGTPVIAFRKGALPEQVIDGKTGILVDFEESPEKLIQVINTFDSIENTEYLNIRNNCRENINNNFNSKKMALKYEDLYSTIVNKNITK